jgi:hypothetical protein
LRMGRMARRENTLAARRHFALSTSGLCIPMVEPAALDAIFAKAHWGLCLFIDGNSAGRGLTSA